MKYDLEACRLLGKTFMRMNRSQEAYDTFKLELSLLEKMAEGVASDSTSSSTKNSTNSTNNNSFDVNLNISTAYSNLGLAAKKCGNLDEAVTHLSCALSRLTSNNEQNLKTPTVANILQNLGQVHAARRDHSAARDAYQKSLEIQLSLFGPDHANVALGYLCLARLVSDNMGGGPICSNSTTTTGPSSSTSSLSNSSSSSSSQAPGCPPGPPSTPPTNGNPPPTNPTTSTTITARVELYDKALSILDAGTDKTKQEKILSELPELPCAERVLSLVASIKKERMALLRK